MFGWVRELHNVFLRPRREIGKGFTRDSTKMVSEKRAGAMPQKVGRNVSCAVLCWFTILELEVIGQGMSGIIVWIFLDEFFF